MSLWRAAIVLQLLYKVLAFFSRLLRNILFERDINRGDSGCAGQRIAASGRGVNKRVAVHHTPNFGCGHERANGHHATAQCLRGGDDIGRNIPVVNAPQFAGATHAGLYFVGNQQDFVFIANLA